MFTKPEQDFDSRVGSNSLKPVGQALEAPNSGAGSNGASSVIGPDLKVTGNLESKGEIRVEGIVEGDIRAARIIVGKQARITGTLIADAVVVGGSVEGSIRSKNLELQSGSRVEGDIFHKSLKIEMGAMFEGKSRQSDDPMSVATDLTVMPPE